ncbi:MAG: ABC transporter permease [Treponema sp.]|jgi:simple sugar transport system permease protein|nr:ABC transporter permease [Treponema sp.]
MAEKKNSLAVLMNDYRTNHAKNITLFILMLAILVLFSALRPDRFPTLRNFRSMLGQFPEFGLLTVAMMLSMVVGGIDLSVVAVANLCGVLAAILLAAGESAGTLSGGTLVFLAIITVLVVAAICGTANGALIALAGVPPILATLGTQGLLMGLAIIFTKGHGITGFPPEIDVIGNRSILGIPIPFLIFALMAAVVTFILRRTRQGFNMYMFGSNPVVSRFSGVNNTMVLIRTYMLSGILAGISSLIMISRTNSMRPGYGTDYLLQAILVAVLGGTDPKGGSASMAGLVMGIMILQFTQSGLNIMAFSAFTKKFIWGLALLLIMVVNYLIAGYHEKKRIRMMRESSGVKA